MRRTALQMIAALALLLAAWPTAHAAALITETFTGSDGGWESRDPLGMAFTNLVGGGNPGDCLRGVCSLSFTPGYEAFVATGRLASANLMGNYTEAGAQVLGLDIKTLHLPAFGSIRINLYSGSNYISKVISDRVTATGTWYSIRLPIHRWTLGGWENDTNLFASIVTNVTRLEINVSRSISGSRTYYLDTIFLDRLHAASGLSTTNTSDIVLAWSNLLVGGHYRLEAAAQITTRGWTLLESFSATSSVYQAQVNATNMASCYRLLLE